MKRVRKGGEPPELKAWRLALRPRNHIPPWIEFGDPARSAVRTRTAEDQHWLCCYCTGLIRRGNYHIEHFRPRESFRQLTYRWRNLLASCETYRRGDVDGEIVETQKHCGDAKDNWFEEGVTADPQGAQVERLFRFPLTGKVTAAKDLPDERYVAAERTINELNLNAPALVARRRNLLALAALHVSEMTREEWEGRYILQAPDGTFQEFWPALSYNYRQLWSRLFERN